MEIKEGAEFKNRKRFNLRNFMKRFIVIIVGLILVSLSAFSQSKIGANNFNNENYIGGLNSRNVPQYNKKLNNSKVDYVVSSRQEFISVLGKIKPGNKIYLSPNLVVDLSDLSPINIPSNVTFFSNRGEKGSKGALLYSNNFNSQALINISGDNVLVFGIRIQGPEGKRFHKGKNSFDGKSDQFIKKNYQKLWKENMYATPVSAGIVTSSNNVVIENCELYNWTHTAVFIKKGAKDISIMNNYIHDNRRFGLGYGITIDQGSSTITGNLFVNNNHSVASQGRSGSEYVVKNNIFKEDTIEDSWAVDMHGGADRKDGTNLAGYRAIVENNTFYLKGTNMAFVIRGTSSEMSKFRNNKIIKLDKKSKNYYMQTNSKGNFEVSNNSFSN